MSLMLYIVLAFAIGFAASLSGPILLMLALGDDGRKIGKSFFKIGLTSAWRPALTVNDVGDLLLKKRSYNDDLNREEISVGGIKRELEDPQDRVHHFFGVPFAFVDEIFGVVFDPRDADAGREAWRHFDDATFVYAEQSERGYFERVRAFFEIPRGDRGVSLASVRHLVGGGNDSAAAQRLIEHYKKSQAPRSSTSATRQLLLPLGAFVLVVLVGWFAFSQTSGGGTGGGSSGTSQTVGYLMLLAIPNLSLRALRDQVREKISSIRSRGNRGDSDKKPSISRTQAVFGGVAVVYLTANLLLTTIIPVVLLGVLNIAAIAGFCFLPGLAFILGRSLGPLGLALAKLYMIMGLIPFERPVVYLNKDDEYGLREATGTNLEKEADWYRFAKSWLGFAYENDEESWPGETSTMSARKVDTLGEDLVADGGDTQLPHGCSPTSTLTYAGHGGFVPTKPTDSEVYLQTHHALAWFRDVCRGETLQIAHQYAKEKYGDGTSPLSDRMLMLMTLAMMVLGVVIDYIAFFS